MRLAPILLFILATAMPAAAQRPEPVGICLVAIEANSPDQEVGGIAYCGASRDCCNYILRTPKGMKIVVSDKRFRGIVYLPTRQSLHAQTPEKELERLEAVANRYPLAASSFATQLTELRQLVKNRRDAPAAPAPSSSPGTRIGSRVYHDFELRAISEGRAIFRHRDGVASLPLDSLTDEERKLLHKLAAEKKPDRGTPVPPKPQPSRVPPN